MTCKTTLTEHNVAVQTGICQIVVMQGFFFDRRNSLLAIAVAAQSCMLSEPMVQDGNPISMGQSWRRFALPAAGEVLAALGAWPRWLSSGCWCAGNGSWGRWMLWLLFGFIEANRRGKLINYGQRCFPNVFSQTRV